MIGSLSSVSNCQTSNEFSDACTAWWPTCGTSRTFDYSILARHGGSRTNKYILICGALTIHKQLDILSKDGEVLEIRRDHADGR
jgi:hypothetical protein